MISRRSLLASAPLWAAATAGRAAQENARIRQIDIVHHTHTDVGYTDPPAVVRDRQKRYIEAAMELCRARKDFRWTVESLVCLEDWWTGASAAQRSEFLRLVRAGQMDAMALPFNQTPFLNARQWKQMMSWIPASLWRAVRPKVAMQNDVNGFPRAGAMALLDHGIRHLLMGINGDGGSSQLLRPSAFWWKMPDGRKLFVWNGDHYGRAMSYLGVTRSSGMPVDEASLKKTQALCAEKLRRLQAAGYPWERLILTFTHPAAYDNGSPYPPLAPFVAAWNRAGLAPSLRLVTATRAAFEMEELIGARMPVIEGEWTDWWANGSASGPRELAASRFAKRSLAAAESAAWGPLPASAAPAVERILKDLCLFDEHTWGASASIRSPYSLNTLGQYVEKSELAYRPMGEAQWLLARRTRTKLEPLPDGVYVANPTPAEFTGWASVNAALLGNGIRSLSNADASGATELRKSGAGTAFWVEKLAPHSIRALRPSTAVVNTSAQGAPAVKLDSAGWPVSASWAGMKRPLFSGGIAEFLAAGPSGNRASTAKLRAETDERKRGEMLARLLRQSAAEYDAARFEETPHTFVYTQPFRHPRLANAQRVAELWRREPRARISVRFDRRSSVDQEMFYLAFTLPEGMPLPVFAGGGAPFTPYRDQIAGTCRDYFAIDGWAHYPTADAGDWLWVTRDAPLAVVGGPHPLAHHQEEPLDRHRILAMVFDNFWHTNFVADSHGVMEFQFDIAWREKIAGPAGLAEMLAADPVVTVNTSLREGPELLKSLYRP